SASSGAWTERRRLLNDASSAVRSAVSVTPLPYRARPSNVRSVVDLAAAVDYRDGSLKRRRPVSNGVLKPRDRHSPRRRPRRDRARPRRLRAALPPRQDRRRGPSARAQEPAAGTPEG